jgi:hypothetical protein
VNDASKYSSKVSLNHKPPPLVCNRLPFGRWHCVAVFSKHLIQASRCQALGALYIFFLQGITIQCHDSAISERSASVYPPSATQMVYDCNKNIYAVARIIVRKYQT